MTNLYKSLLKLLNKLIQFAKEYIDGSSVTILIKRQLRKIEAIV